MTTVSAIALKAFNGIAAKISGVVQACSVTDGVTTYEGRAIFSRSKPTSEFTGMSPQGMAYEVILQGLEGTPADGWTIAADVDWLLLSVVDVVQAGELFQGMAIKEADLWNNTVSLQTKTRTANGTGGYSASWNSPTAVDCYFAGLGGSERWQAMRVLPGNRWRCIIAYQADITSSMRAVIDGKAYAIESVTDMSGRGKWLELMLTEGAT